MKWLREFFRRSSSAIPEDELTEQERRLMKNIAPFERALGVSIRNRDLFVQALLHRSFLQRPSHDSRSNERLEFLGDSVLNLIVGEYLFERLPRAEEGELTQRRAQLVNRKALAAYARDLGLAEFILMSPSAAQSGRKGSDTITADCFEAVIAAIYLDRGYTTARDFVTGRLERAIRQGAVATWDDNYKSRLLEHSQSEGTGVPRYVVVRQEGPDHDRTFVVEVTLSDGRKGRGTGKNKKEAEQAAAQDALRRLRVSHS
jgi:ribonuclease-3